MSKVFLSLMVPEIHMTTYSQGSVQPKGCHFQSLEGTAPPGLVPCITYMDICAGPIWVMELPVEA